MVEGAGTRWSGHRFAIAAFVLAVVLGLFVSFAPLGQTCSVTGGPGRSSDQERCTTTSIFETDGAWVLFLVSVPIVLTLVPVLIRRRAAAIVSAVLLWAICIIGVVSLGLFFMPSAVLITIAATRPFPSGVPPDPMTSRWRFTLASFLAAVLGGLVAAFAPLARGCQVSMDAGSMTEQRSCFSASTYQTDGSWVLVVVSVPIAIAFVPVLVRHRVAAIVSAVLLWACCVVGLWSVGMFFVPAAVLMTIAAARPEPVPAATNV